MRYKVIKKEEFKNSTGSVGQNLKKSILLSGDWNGPYAIATIVVDGVVPKAEIHSKAVDVWHIIKGKGKFILGGSLVNPKKTSENEWVGDSIQNGEEFEVGKGDWVDTPPGVPHQINAKGERLEMMIIKI